MNNDIKKSLQDLADFLSKNENIKSLRISFTLENTKSNKDKKETTNK